MIELLHYYLLRADENYNFAERIIYIIQNNAAEASTIHPLLANLILAKEKLDENLVKISTKNLTRKVKGLDRARDSCFIGMRDIAKACLRRPNPEWQEAAQQIVDSLRGYGWELHNESYTVESSKLKNLFSDLETIDVLVAAMETIGLTGWKDDLKSLQAEFDVAVEERTKANSEITLSETKEACKEVEDACKDIFKYLEVMNMVQPLPEVTTMIKLSNEVIHEFNSMINVRLGKRSATKEDAATSEN